MSVSGAGRWLVLPFLSGLPMFAAASSPQDEPLFRNARQVTFEGRRAGEAYLQGSRMIFQSEREEGNPFFQIYVMDLETGDTRRVSTGAGKTTCGWLHPDGRRALYASTHEDPDARRKQDEELARRARGEERRYSWDYDEHYDLFEATLDGKILRNLTATRGYDAEGSWSPDGNRIVFASNRADPSEELSPEDRERFERDPSYLMEIYVMDADGAGVRRLTRHKGYDGGPFFSPDGSKICWRRFSPDGATAEIYTMNADGSDPKQITRLGAMSWAPFFSPEGDSLIFATNVHGFANFELYLVDAQGSHAPVRVTDAEGFDGLPVLHGGRLAWTCNRTSDRTAQVFFADWDHARARQRLGLPRPPGAAPPKREDRRKEPHEIRAEDLRGIVERLASPDFEGRATGTEGERKAVEYVAEFFRGIGLDPVTEEFEFTAGASLGPDGRLGRPGEEDLAAGRDWIPLSSSGAGDYAAAPVVFAGYGLEAPDYDSYAHLLVKDKWVLVLEGAPPGKEALSAHAEPRRKVRAARDRGARGLLIAGRGLAEFRPGVASGAGGIAAVSITEEAAAKLLAPSGKDLARLRQELETGALAMGFEVAGVRLEAKIDIRRVQRKGRNVYARIKGDGGGTVALGAHVDHLGRGEGGGSLARGDEKGGIHCGADDNASGVAAVLEIAQWLAHGKPALKHDVLFAIWSGEEQGLLGSGTFDPAGVVAYLNLDMVGRLDKSLVLQGVGSSPAWPRQIERANAIVGLPIAIRSDPYLPTDSTSLYLKGVPVLDAFTGLHSDYHSPRDTADKLNYPGTEKIAELMGRIVAALATGGEKPAYRRIEKPKSRSASLGRAFLGTVPDYAQGDLKGVKLSGVAKGGPAEQGGVLGGDVIVGLAGKKIENIYDYTDALSGLKVGQPVVLIVEREGQRLDLTVTPKSRE
jgi:Tol biopolymer transport system component